MSVEQLKHEIATLTDQEQKDLISYTLQLRYSHDPVYRREVSDRLNETDKSAWVTPDEFERRLDQH